MEYIKLGNSGIEVSRLCLGCMGVKLTAEDVAYIDELYVPHRIVGAL
mgnify:FL=1